MIAVCSEINTKHTIQRVQKEKFLNIKSAGATRGHWALKG
jgi:hypothetical protein